MIIDDVTIYFVKMFDLFGQNIANYCYVERFLKLVILEVKVRSAKC